MFQSMESIKIGDDQYFKNPMLHTIELKRRTAPSTSIKVETLLKAVDESHRILEQIKSFPVNIFKLLGMRNLSAFVGEIFSVSVEKISDGQIIKNPHQDGYPDLLPLDSIGKKIFLELSDKLQEKEPFSPFKGGGFEVKATCGSVGTPKSLAKIGLKKPELEETRMHLLKSYDWKAHHQETNNLIGILWDFVERVPKIMALFYSNQLSKKEWGNIVKPRDGGGRTTSVSIMKREGIYKMYQGWILVKQKKGLIEFLNKYNKDNKLTLLDL